MSTESTLLHYKGEWKFKGPTNWGFDEIRLLLTNEKVKLIKMSGGVEIEQSDFSAKPHFEAKFLMFLGIGKGVRALPLFVVDANEQSMVCGQQENAIVGLENAKWAVKLERV